MSTKADLLTAWCKWTGDRVPEARHRIRALSEADLLPSRAHPLSYEDLARALLGFVATAQHKDAPEAVRKFSAARCGAASADNQEVPLMGMSLLEAVTAALQPPFWIAGFTVNTTTGFCRLEVVNGWLTSDWDGTKVTVPGSMAEYWFKDHADPRPTRDGSSCGAVTGDPQPADRPLADRPDEPSRTARCRCRGHEKRRHSNGAREGGSLAWAGGAHPRAKAAHHARRST